MQLLLLVHLNAHGNSATATKLATARNIKLQGAVSGNVNFDGSGNVVITTTQANIAVVTGIIEMPEKSNSVLGGTTEINYPEGFTKDNSVIISLMSHNSVYKDYWSTPSINNSNSMILGNGNLRASLRSEFIKVYADKVNIEENRKDITFKIVLMKVS